MLRHPENENLVSELIAVIEAGERGDCEMLYEVLFAERASVRYWAATWLDNLGDKSAAAKLAKRTRDVAPAVRVASALTLCKLGRHQEYLSVLAEHSNAR